MLPVPAIYVIDVDGRIRYAHVDPNYTRRARAVCRRFSRSWLLLPAACSRRHDAAFQPEIVCYRTS